MRDAQAVNDFERRISNPRGDVSLLNHYSGVFDAIFIALHPFYKIDGIAPAGAERSVINIERADLGESPLTKERIDQLVETHNLPSTVDWHVISRQSKSCGAAVPWDEVKRGSHLTSLKQVNQSLLGTIGAIKPNFRDAEATELLTRYCSNNNLFLPDEDRFPAILETRICTLFRRLGYDVIYFVDEFEDAMESVPLEELEIPEPWFLSAGDLELFRFNRFFPEDRSLLCVTPWDNFYTAICGERNALSGAGVDDLFDGFWCDGNTTISWWQHK